MTKDCIFCKIISGELPADKVYEDDDFIAFQSLYQSSKGHTLIVPKEHSKDILEMNSELGSKLLKLTQEIGTAIMKGLNADGFNVGVNTKEAAGQEIFHTHIHIIPRYKDDNMKLWGKINTTPAERVIFAQKIITHID
jgi:histidine triad (HIT) family protein